ncbi:hypothetical protein ITJ38_03370 [Agreia pratensis]|uniref:putative PEP-binding protein n=1 Tax=Agreia pratensis TaxID=150121 RepID=UPI00188D752A|nr:putative PEP-binding protein [Agreia pratensis]MBF4633438.1 hypothetical protein [Agreia pratensis]
MKYQRESVQGFHVSDFDNEASQIFLHVDDLAETNLLHLDRVRAIFYKSKGSSSHVEVICSIKGIPLIHESPESRRSLQNTTAETLELSFEVSAAARQAFLEFKGQYQVSAFQVDDLAALEMGRIDTVFVRMEHLLYKIAAESPQGERQILDPRKLRDEIEAFANALPPTTRLLVRGSDVRSNDRVLSAQFFDKSEPNPDLGQHGARYLLANEDRAALELEVVSDIPGLIYAVPFVANASDFEEFSRRHRAAGVTLAPFIESPAVFSQIARYNDFVCIGLKDIAQYYFAADRSNAAMSPYIDFLDEDFSGQLAFIVDSARRSDTTISVYQNRDVFGHFVKLFGTDGWVPSISANEYRELAIAANT